MRALIDRAKRGEQAARHELAIALWPRLLSMAKYYARTSGDDPDDLLGEGWCALFAALDQVDLDIGRPECFLIERARWRMLDYIKWHRRRRDTEPEQEPACPDTRDLAGTIAGETLVSELAADLTDTQRLVLAGVLRGHTCREVAARLGCSGANVAYHVRRIREKWTALSGEAMPVE